MYDIPEVEEETQKRSDWDCDIFNIVTDNLAMWQSEHHLKDIASAHQISPNYSHLIPYHLKKLSLKQVTYMTHLHWLSQCVNAIFLVVFDMISLFPQMASCIVVQC